MYRKAYKLFLIITLALIMVGGSFLVSMANSAAPESQAVESSGETEHQDAQNDQVEQDDQIESGDQDDDIGSAPSGNAVDEDYPPAEDSDDVVVDEEDEADGEVTDSEGAEEGDVDVSSAGTESNVASNDNTSVEGNNESFPAGALREPHEEEPTITVMEEPPADSEATVSEEAPDINQTPASETKNKDGTVTIKYIEADSHTMATEKPKKYHKDPTCDEAGYNIVDIHCLYHENLVLQRTIETIPALGHEMGDWEVVKNATAFEDGIVARHCLREGCNHMEIETLCMVVVEPDPDEEISEISFIYEAPSDDPRTAYRSYGNSRAVYTASVSAIPPVIIESEDDAVDDAFELPSSDISSPNTDEGSNDLVESSGTSANIMLVIDLLLSLGLVAGLGVLWKLGLMRVR